MKLKYLSIALLCLINVVIFTNSLYGDFVYDDTRQIVRNPLIQEPALFGKALISDVWAFKGDGSVAASNYWRPTFTASSILSFQAFGLNPVGWHALNILLHIGVCVLAFLLLVRWGLSISVAFAISLVFAAHPIHVESVSWIAGLPDLLFSFCLLASFWFADNYSNIMNRFDLILALIFFSFAIGSKEVAFLCFPIYWIIFSKGNENSNKNSFKLTGLFLVIASTYFLLRWLVLGQISQSTPDSPSLTNAILTVPTAFIFYLKQIIFPLSLGTNYPLRPVENFDILNFLLPLIVSVAAPIVLFLLAKRSFVQKLGLFIFLLPLIPAMNFTAFKPEEIVHDRYLYLPLLGFLMIFVPYLNELFEKISKERAEQIVLIFALLISIPLGIKTIFYNQVWANDRALWEHNITIDANSSTNWAHYGAALLEQSEYQKAVEAYDNSLDIKLTSLALMGRARGNLHLKKLEEAVWDLKTVTEMKNEDSNAYTLYQTYEALAIAYSEQGKPEDAANILIESRKRLPIYYAALTEKLAIVYYQADKKAVALRELESAKTQAKVEFLPESKAVLLRLGMLYAELGEKEKSREVLTEYLKLTAALQDNLTIGDRKQAFELLKQIQ